MWWEDCSWIKTLGMPWRKFVCHFNMKQNSHLFFNFKGGLFWSWNFICDGHGEGSIRIDTSCGWGWQLDEPICPILEEIWNTGSEHDLWSAGHKSDTKWTHLLSIPMWGSDRKLCPTSGQLGHILYRRRGCPICRNGNQVQLFKQNLPREASRVSCSKTKWPPWVYSGPRI